MRSKNTAFLVLGTCAIVTIGFFVVPPITKKVSTKIYKVNLKTEEIDFNNLGPEIVKTETIANGEEA